MKLTSQFKRQALFLFFIVSLLPALTVSALWYYFARNNGNVTVGVGQYVAPIMLLGLAPAIVLSVAFAELLVVPIRRIHQAIGQIAIGNLSYRLKFNRFGEFQEMAEALNEIAGNLQVTLSQAAAENQTINAERTKLRAVLNTMTDGLVALDSAGKIALFNQAASTLTGHTVGAAAGQSLHLVVELTKDGRPVVEDWLKVPHHDQSVKSWRDLKLARSAAPSLTVDVQVVRINDDPNGITALITIHDVTPEAELEEMKVDFVALAAHELRTPLTTIKGYLDILDHEAGEKLDADQRGFLRRTMSEANQLTGLINNLLNVSKIERGELSYDPEACNWYDFIEQLTPVLISRTKEQNRELIVNVPKDLPQVAIDPLAINEVLINLVNNSINHTASGGHITIASRLAGKEVETTVTDDGGGIPKAALDHLFTKFYRVEGLRSGRGTGLGLFLSKSIIEAHHGYMWVQSELGKGATFGFNLPLATTVAAGGPDGDNKASIKIEGTHGWIKAHTHH